MAYTNGTIQENNGDENVNSDGITEVCYDCLIIGTGPAGASLACFLAQNGLKGLIVTQDPSNADTPRAHITNMAAIDVS
jgi:alkyl hydroperoxide reductase subunit AhpF